MTLIRLALASALIFTSNALADSDPPHPEGLLLRGFESEGAANRRGDQAVRNGVATTVRVDAAGELSATVDSADLAPLIEWYRDRGQYYSAYADFAPGIASAIGFQADISPDGKTLDLDGNESSPSIFLSETYEATLAVAKAYVDAGVDAIHYDTAWVTGDAGPFDGQTLSDFREWLNSRYSEATLQSYFDPSYDADTFDYGAFLRSEGVTASNYATASVNGSPLGGSKHWRLWLAFLRSKEREVIASLVDSVNTYALSELGREIGFYFNRYGFIDRPADRWFLAEYASGDLGETHFDGQTWDFHAGYSLEPVFRAGLKAFDNRFEPWNSPPQTYAATQSVFLAETLANNGVGTWEDDYPATSAVARLARRYSHQLDHAPVSEAAIFYPLATVLHTESLQVGPDPGLLGGDHYWYLGLGYILQELNVNYDVAFGGDALGMPDAFSSSDLSGYEVVFASEAIQVTDNQFTELLDYVNAGGTLLVMGSNCFRYDPLGEDMASVRSYAGQSWSDLFGSVGDTAIGSGTVKVLSLDPWGSTGFTDQPGSSQLSNILSGVAAALPSGAPAVSHAASGDVRVIRYRDGSDQSEVYHLINYSFNASGSSVTSQSDFTLDFPTPSSYAGTPIAHYASSADSDPTALPITDLGGGISRVTIPSLDYWGILRIGSAMDATAHPNIEPIAYFEPLFDYEAFTTSASRELTYTAVDDEEISQIQVYYQLKDSETGLFGGWTAGDSTAVGSTNEQTDQPLIVSLPSEGHFRLQLIATDNEGDANALISNAYDTELGYDTTPMDISELVVTPGHGIADGGVTTSPVTPTFAVSGYDDPVSGYGQYNYSWNNGGNTIAGGGDPLADTLNFDSLPAIVEGEYGEYVLTLRFQNGAGIWDDGSNVYTLVYTLPPSYNGEETNRSEAAGASVTLALDYTSVFGDVSIQWYKDDVAIDGQTDSQLDLNAISDSDEGTYHATIANRAGSVTSADFNLTVETPLEITSQPQGATVNAGDPFSITVDARGEGALSYQWMLDNEDIDGATSETYSVPSADRAIHQGPYRVRITDSLTSTTSNSAFVTVNDQPGGGGGGGSTPNQPMNLSAADSGSSVNLTWEDKSADETGFAIERRESGAETWVSVANRPADTTNFNDATDIGNLTYEYRVKATGSEGDSEYSNVASVSRSEDETPLPAAPADLAATDKGDSVSLAWEDLSNDETGFLVQRRVQGEPTWEDLGETPANATAYQDLIDIGGSIYEYRVAAQRGADLSKFSNTAGIERPSGGGGDLTITAIVSGIWSFSGSMEDTDTLQDLRDAIATEAGVNGSELLVYRGDTLLDQPGLALSELGLSDGDQISAVLDSDSDDLGYATWQLSYFGAAVERRLPEDDFNGDGIPNILHYATGTDPIARLTGDPLLTLEFGDSSVSLSYVRNAEAPEATLSLHLRADDMAEWQSAASMELTVAATPVEDAGLERLTWTYAGALPEIVLARLSVSRPSEH